MREPFTAHARLMAGAQRWQRAEAEHTAARIRRYADLLQAIEDGYGLDDIAAHYGITRRGIERALQRGRELYSPSTNRRTA